MKKIKFLKKTVAVSLAALALTSCSRIGYADDVSCSDIGSEAVSSLGDGLEYSLLDNEHLSFYFDETEDYNDCYVVYSSDTNNINEIGVFHAANKDDAEDLSEMCREYLEDMQENSRAFIASYAPSELPKLDNAQVRRFGNYVVYTVLDDNQADVIFEKVKEQLKK